ncbi:MAG: 16S rRNA (uracil(1498)-N(3))-methyltransferase [Acutalibacteraceae bacterium]|nr:16S rRNA (uracil(1498)-N(3))-methyltransferase [Acutalibacteraceae bacterium]
MYNFFAEKNSRNKDCYFISGSDYNHIKNVLRMNIGDTFLISDEGKSHLCEIDKFEGECVIARVIQENYQDTNLPAKIYLFQGLPKSDKLELIIQKAVELGVEEIIPVEMSRCVVKLDDKKKKSKVQRWQSIAESAAKQSKRTSIPVVSDVMTFRNAVEKASAMDCFIVPYENKEGMKATSDALAQIKKGSSIGIMIGPEGGFEETEIETAVSLGGKTVSLGKRILRTETAAITSVAMCMLYIEMNINGDE